MVGMVTGPFPYEPPEPPPAPAAPPSKAGRPTSLIALAAGALFVVGGIAGGGLGAQAILNRPPAPTRAPPRAPVPRSAAASSVPVAQTPISAAAIYKQAAPGVVTITTEVAGRNG